MTEAWTIDRISGALGTPVLTQRFLSEINRAPAHELLGVFAHWQGIAESLAAAAERGRRIAVEDDGTEWIDVTDRARAAAEKVRRSAA